jgi:hypothetical protein
MTTYIPRVIIRTVKRSYTLKKKLMQILTQQGSTLREPPLLSTEMLHYVACQTFTNFIFRVSKQCYPHMANRFKQAGVGAKRTNRSKEKYRGVNALKKVIFCEYQETEIVTRVIDLMNMWASQNGCS